MKASFTDQFVRYYSQSMRRLVQAMALSVLSGMIVTLPVRSADKLYFDYGVLGRQISVSSLETFAIDGTIDAELAPYLDEISLEKRLELQRILSTPLVSLSNDMPEQIGDPFVLSQWLYSPIGDIVLESVGQLIQTGGHQNGQQAIRAAMVLAAADPAGLSLINILRFYPTSGLRLDLPQILALSNAVRTDIDTTDRLVKATIQQSVATAATEPTLDYQALPMLADVPRFDVVKRSLMLEDRDRTFPTDLYLPADSFDVMELVNRPLDIRFLLDTLEEKNKTEFQERLQLDRVGVVGHSFGGYTALATAGATVDVGRLEQQCDPEADIVPDNVNIALLIQCRLLELKASPQVLQQLTSRHGVYFMKDRQGETIYI